MKEISTMEVAEDVQNIEHADSPLNTYLVLSEIAGYCSVTDLKSFRQVSRLWYTSSLKAWKSSAKVKLECSFWGNGKEKLQNFMKFSEEYLNKDYGSFPFANFEVEGVLTKEFWKICGTHIKTLKICKTEFPLVNNLRYVIYKCCPNMQNLTLKNVYVMDTIPKEREYARIWRKHRNLKSLTIGYVNLKISWSELFKQYPSIETLNLTGGISYYDGIFQALHETRICVPNTLNLKHIHIPLEISDVNIPKEIMTVLLSPNLKLKSLSININGSCGTHDLKAIVSSHGQSLEKLSLYRHHEPRLDPSDIFYRQPIWGFPLVPVQLENLQELNLMSQRVFSSFEYLRHMPNLRKLRMRSEVDLLRNFDLPEMPGVLLPHCKDLGIFGQIMTQDLKQLMDILPNVEILQMELNNQQFAEVCERWPKLTSLKLTIGYGSEVDDSGITGLNLVEAYKINDSASKHENYAWSLYPAPTANILNLKHLRAFSMYPSIYEGPLKLGYCAAAYGFQKLPSLKHLHVHKRLRSNNRIWSILHEQFLWLE